MSGVPHVGGQTRQSAIERADVIAGLTRSASTAATKHDQIREALLEFIGTAAQGDMLPSERVLAERLGAARMTVRSCLMELERQGYVHREHGRGTFVQRGRAAHSGVLRSFSEDMRLRGLQPSSTGLATRIRPARAEVAEQLGVDPGIPVLQVERVRTADGIPMALERTSFVADDFPDLAGHLRGGASLYDVLETEYGVRIESADQLITIATLTAGEARRLGVASGECAFLITRVSRDETGRVVEFGTSLYRRDRYEIQMHVSRRG